MVSSVALILVLGPAASRELPEVRLDDLEPAVARQLAQVRNRLDASAPTATLFGDAARHYHAYGLVAAAEACYRKADSLDPHEFRWPYLLGVLLMEDNRLDEAAQSLQRALDRKDNYYPALIRLAGLYVAQGRSDEAVALVETARRHAPEDPTLLALTGQLALAQGRNAEAVADLTKALELDPRATRLRYLLGMAYRAAGRLDQARVQLTQAGSVDVKPRDPLVDAMLALRQGERSSMIQGHAAFRLGDYVGAAAAYRQAVEQSNGASPDALVHLAVAEGRLGQVEEAIAHLRQAQIRNPTDADVLYNLSAFLARAGRHTEAEPLLRTLVQRVPTDDAARISWGLTLLALNRTDDALAALESVEHVERESCSPVAVGLVALFASIETDIAARARTLERRLRAGPCPASQP